MIDKVLKRTNDLLKYLPTGTVFLFQMLNPFVTLRGHCTPITEVFDVLLIVFCCFTCFISCFTDSYMGSDGLVHYGIATLNGIWPSPASKNIDMSKYKLTLGDVVDAFWTVIIFLVVSVLDPNTAGCLYPMFLAGQAVLVKVLPPVVALVAGIVFYFFPKKRHGIGNPLNLQASYPGCYVHQ